MPLFIFNVQTTIEIEAEDEDEAYDILNEEGYDNDGEAVEVSQESMNVIDRDVMLVEVI